MKNKLIILVVSVMIFSGCKDLLSPADQNDRSLDVIYNNAPFAEGLLMNGYVRLPTGGYSFNDVATDDAVSNDGGNNYLLMATGKWSSLNNPMDQWANAFAAIQYLNITLEQTDKVNWATTGLYTKEMFNDRTKGEAYGLRALFMYYLLQAHGGYTSDGKLMGVPIILKSLDTNSDVNLPRNTFAECLTQIYADLDLAESYLPLDFEDITATSQLQLPSKYAAKTTVSDYNRVFGAFDRGRLTARIVKGIRAQVSLLAASPAFNQDPSKWSKAADDAAAVLDINGTGGISGLASNGAKWYASSNATEIDGLALGANPKEVLWRTNVASSNNLESDNYPPTLYGKGRTNPTQNLVDAFPGANGYPITNVTSKYNPAKPYTSRDPRLTLYIAVNGSKMGPGSTVVSTETGKTIDGFDSTSTSTRTGYYMRKLLREDVNLSPSTPTSQKHYVSRIRYTEIYLAYAEAANEAGGPDWTGSHAYSARQVIAAIRKRAGITQPDKYLASITSADDMRTLIHNERRLELCFEGTRFWDLRRWKVSSSDLTAEAMGMKITGSAYVTVPVEVRSYKDYMYYGPIPNLEILKFNNLVQNTGW